MPQGGDLDRRIVIERYGVIQDDFGGEVEAWTILAQRWARRSDVSDGERHQADETGASLMTRFTLRSDAVTRTITPKDRIVHDGRFWNIHGVKEAKGPRRAYLEITAAVRTDG